MTLDNVYEFIKRHKLAVVSTVDIESEPESAVVEFGEYGNFNIIIDTLVTSRKYTNLQTNKSVALVIGWDEKITVQINAIATLLKGDELDLAKQSFFAKNKRAQKWESREDVAYFGLKPQWIRYSDLEKNPWQITEYQI